MTTKARKHCRDRQLTLRFTTRGGPREGAGRKKGAGVSHERRPTVTRHSGLLLTWKVLSGLPSLRHREGRGLLMGVMAAGCDRQGFRVVQFSIQKDHLHVVSEAEDNRSLAEGTKDWRSAWPERSTGSGSAREQSSRSAITFGSSSRSWR